MSLNVDITGTFRGPLDLLHSLILRDEIDIHNIPIAKLAATYLEEIRKLEFVNVDEGAEFLDLASRLMEIKLRMLAPDEAEEGDESEEDDFDPRSGLVAALLEYRRFKDAARILGDLMEEQSKRFPRVSPRFEFRITENPVTDDGGAAVGDLVMSFQSILDRMLASDLAAPNVITTEEIPISTRIEQVRTVLREKGRARFSFLLSGIPNRFEMVGFFIAVLELMRQGKISARQTDNFSDIILEPRESSLPAADLRSHGLARPDRFRRRPDRAFPSALALYGPGRKATAKREPHGSVARAAALEFRRIHGLFGQGIKENAAAGVPLKTSGSAAAKMPAGLFPKIPAGNSGVAPTPKAPAPAPLFPVTAGIFPPNRGGANRHFGRTGP